jgi:hypothetical protein
LSHLPSPALTTRWGMGMHLPLECHMPACRQRVDTLLPFLQFTCSRQQGTGGLSPTWGLSFPDTPSVGLGYPKFLLDCWVDWD